MNKNELKEIACQGEGCGREAYQEDEDEDYYVCGRCGWAGSSNNPVVVLQRQLAEINKFKELKMLVHKMIEHATQALKRHDSNDNHWKVLLSLLRFTAEDYVKLFEQLEDEIEIERDEEE